MEGNKLPKISDVNKENALTTEIFNKDFASLPKAYDLYSEFIGMSEIEKCKEEDYVLANLLKGVSESKILEYLKNKHPDHAYKFTPSDILRFIERNRDVTSQLEKYNGLSARRHFVAKAQCEEALAELALYTKKLMVDLRKEGDNTNAISAAKALSQMLKMWMEMQGYIKGRPDDSNVTNVINIVSDEYDLKDRAHKADFKIIEDIKEE